MRARVPTILSVLASVVGIAAGMIAWMPNDKPLNGQFLFCDLDRQPRFDLIATLPDDVTTVTFDANSRGVRVIPRRFVGRYISIFKKDANGPELLSYQVPDFGREMTIVVVPK